VPTGAELSALIVMDWLAVAPASTENVLPQPALQVIEEGKHESSLHLRQEQHASQMTEMQSAFGAALLDYLQRRLRQHILVDAGATASQSITIKADSSAPVGTSGGTATASNGTATGSGNISVTVTAPAPTTINKISGS